MNLGCWLAVPFWETLTALRCRDSMHTKDRRRLRFRETLTALRGCSSVSVKNWVWMPRTRHCTSSNYLRIWRGLKTLGSRWTGHVARMEEGRSVFKILTDKPTRKIQLGRLKSGWEDNVRTDFKEIAACARNLGWFSSGYIGYILMVLFFNPNSPLLCFRYHIVSMLFLVYLIFFCHGFHWNNNFGNLSSLIINTGLDNLLQFILVYSLLPPCIPCLVILLVRIIFQLL